ncbi:unnamed protein product [Periconia digitata]|uniref:NAD-dependent epimerase/dehydratase domain-containing protein n=1 Tax=Periconia digitata TaxID=1303443 RepID=A0A9W4U8M2_9PLEO|nr:unnamed protein product [Periconia digitata]
MPLRVAVLGSTGFTGSYLTVELLHRGHTVIGLSRDPSKIGSHARYEPCSIDIAERSFTELREVLEDKVRCEVLIVAYGPGPNGGGEDGVYMTFLETVRKAILAVKTIKNNEGSGKNKRPYLIFIGGAGSLHAPSTHEACIDTPTFLLAYRRALGTSAAQIAYMEARAGTLLPGLHAYRSARISQTNGTATAAELSTITAFDSDDESMKSAVRFIKAARAAYLFFEGDEGFEWSFVSPAALYRAGRGTGGYEVKVDEVVLVGERREGESVFEGRLTGVQAGDLARAVVDEVEGRRLVWRHWCAWGDVEGVEGSGEVVLGLGECVG